MDQNLNVTNFLKLITAVSSISIVPSVLSDYEAGPASVQKVESASSEECISK